MFKETANRIDYWEDEVERLKKEIAEAKANNVSEETLIDLSVALHEVKENLNHAWQDDELEEMELR